MSNVNIDHLFLKELGRKNVLFPISKKEIAEKLKDSVFQLSANTTVSAASCLENVKPDYFDNGSAFLCAFHSAFYSELKKAFVSEKQHGVPL